MLLVVDAAAAGAAVVSMDENDTAGTYALCNDYAQLPWARATSIYCQRCFTFQGRRCNRNYKA